MDFDDFGNEGLLPCQFYSARRDLEPERRLALAVLESAIRDLRSKGGATGRPTHAMRESARLWLLDDATGPFTVNGVCDLLGIEASVLRARLKDWDGTISRRSAVNGNGGARPTVARVKR